MALRFSSGLLTGLQQYGQGGGVPSDPRQRNAMQAAGVTNPLLQQFGMGLGGMLGTEMRSPAAIQQAEQKAQQEQAAIREQSAASLYAQVMQEKDPAKLRQIASQLAPLDRDLATKVLEMATTMEETGKDLAGESRYLNTGGGTVFDLVDGKFLSAEKAKQVKADALTFNKAADLVKEGVVDLESYQKAIKNKDISLIQFREKPQEAPQDMTELRASFNNAIQTATEALDVAPESATEALSQSVAGKLGIPWSEGVTLEGFVDTLKGNLAFDKLQAMRDASKTGGALGQVSNIELRLLESALTSLNPKAKNFKDQLQKVIDHYSRLVDAIDKSNTTPEAEQTLPTGYEKVDNTVYVVKEVKGKKYYSNGKNWFEMAE